MLEIEVFENEFWLSNKLGDSGDRLKFWLADCKDLFEDANLVKVSFVRSYLSRFRSVLFSSIINVSMLAVLVILILNSLKVAFTIANNWVPILQKLVQSCSSDKGFVLHCEKLATINRS